MEINDRDILRQLGSGATVDSVCQSAGMSREEFDEWWKRTVESRVPAMEGAAIAAVSARVSIHRDAVGIPHIFADNDSDLFFGFGYAMAQDRLFQLDYLRRRGLGRLSEVLGTDGLERDVVARTVGLNRIAEREWSQLDSETCSILESFTAGVNAVIRETSDAPPIEFDLLGYRPEPWTPVDCLAIESEFRWYLTGRLPILALPELAKRTLGEGPLYEEFILGEADDESILHRGEYDSSGDGSQCEPVGDVMNDPDANIGSNNWVVSGRRTTTGLPLLASDPHIAFEAVSCWYEVHLCGGSFNVAGMTYVGMPAVMFGRNERVAWGITNNICSQRDLYLERTDEEHTGSFEYDGEWERERTLTETITVKDEPDLEKTIRFSRNGPIVDELLPPGFQHTGPVALKWLGAHKGGWLTSLLGIDRATNVDEFRESLRPWHVPTFSLVFSDVDGRIGFQTSGRVPVRNELERGYRPGWDPEHQWQGLIPFDSMPSLNDPDRGWIASANNRLAPNDFPYKLFGCWSSGWRAQRIREMIEASPQLSFNDIQLMQQDVKSLRAVELVPMLVSILDGHSDPRVQSALRCLEAWDCVSSPDSNAATVFNVFFTNWCRTIARERFDENAVELMTNGVSGFAGRLLKSDSAGWFQGNDRQDRIVAAFVETLDLLSDRFGPKLDDWSWGNLHSMPLKHVLSNRGELGSLLNHGGSGVRGDMVTVCNSGSGSGWSAASGAGYRLIADLSIQPPVLHAADAQSQSGHPGSCHYCDQFATWQAGEHHVIPLDRDAAIGASRSQRVLEPEV